jgi:hypothetical protein
VIVLTPEMIELTKWLMQMQPDGPLFRNEDAGEWNGNSIRCRLRRVRQKLGLGGGLVADLYAAELALPDIDWCCRGRQGREVREAGLCVELTSPAG